MRGSNVLLHCHLVIRAIELILVPLPNANRGNIATTILCRPALKSTGVVDKSAEFSGDVNFVVSSVTKGRLRRHIDPDPGD